MMVDLSTYALAALREDAGLLLSRGSRADGSVLVWAPASLTSEPATLRHLVHAFRLRDRIASEWAARPRELVELDGRTALILDDPGGEPLPAQGLSFASKVRIAIGLAAALHGLHGRGLVHKDIKPAHLLVERSSGRVWLTGFGNASELPRERRVPEAPETIAGTLAYMAPEQTGRMNRSVDARSDLYSAGVTLHELFAGTLPFHATSPMEWIHCHIARTPPPLVAPGVSPSIAAIVRKLLAKMPEDRYQTAAGLEADLRRSLASTELFALGEHDASARLVIPEKLYGREPEIHALLAAFERVVKSKRVELVLVSGYSGIGKSAVVSELHKALVPPRGLFAAGKFDQYKRGIPYATLAQAFSGLVRQILTKSDAEVATWRAALQEALGVNGALVVGLIPEIEHILGPQPPVADLPPPDTRSRFQRVLRRFIGVFARPEHPLALFLDDLQWLDSATLDLLEHLLSSTEVGNLLLVGAYRDNEVDDAHPLVRTMNAIRRADGAFHEIVLAPLTVDDVTALVADALHCGTPAARPLAELLHEKTGGNPFFTTQFFAMLAEAGLLVFDHARATWQWDIERIRSQHYTDNVVVLMSSKLGRLPQPAQDVLQRFACLGNAAELGTLADVCDLTREQLDVALAPALEMGLVFTVGETCTFLHDRVQEAAYALVAPDARPAMHLRIGRKLAARVTNAETDESVFEVVGQLNRSLGLLDEDGERESVARFNLVAGKRAKAGAAYGAALGYLAAGLTLVAGAGADGGDGETGDDGATARSLEFELELHSADCEFLTGEPHLAEARLARLATRATTVSERSLVTCLQVVLYTALDRSDRAIAACFEYLRSVGIDWPLEPGPEMVRAEYEGIWARLGERDVDELVDLPRIVDPDIQATIDVLTAVQPAALYLDANLNGLIVCRMVNLSLEHGNCDASCYAYVIFAMLLGPFFGAYERAYAFGKLAYDLVELRGLEKFKARVLMCFGNIVSPWRKHARDGRPLVRRAFAAAQESGDLTFAVYSCHNLVTNLLVCGDPLEEVQRAAESGFEFASKARITLAADFITGQLRLIMSLRGSLPRFGFFDDETFSEPVFEAHLAANPSLSMATCWYWIRKLQARFHAGEMSDALAASAVAGRLLWTSPSFLEVCDFHFYTALTLAGMPGATVSDQLRHHQRELEMESQCCPVNFENRALLVAAEIARLEGRAGDAMLLYARSVEAARKHGFVENEALASELAAAFCTASGVEAVAESYLRRARKGYERWGAHGKVKQLTDTHVSLRAGRPAISPSTGTSMGELDIATVVKMSLAVSGEILLDRLVEKLMALALEHAGAVRGLLVVPEHDTLRVKAEATTAPEGVTVRLHGVAEAELPESVLRFAARSLESVILNDAQSPNEFSADPYIVRTRTRSALCLPLVKQAQLMGVLYLENNLSAYVFTPPRIAVLQLLASQAAIALENARLYTDVRQRDAYLAEAQRASHTGSFGWSVATGALFWSAETYQIFGYPTDVVPTLETVLARVHPDDVAGVAELFHETTERRASWNGEHRLAMADGTIKHLRFLAHRIEGADGAEYVGAVVDITETKQSESLRHDKQIAEAANRAKDEFLANVSHEIRTPMNAILGMTELVLDSPLRNDQRESLRTVRSAAVGLLEIINDLLDFSKIEAGKIELDLAPFALRSLLGETMRALAIRAHRKGLELVCDVQADVPDSVIGDAGRLRQVMVNLVGNAIKFTPAGEIVVEVRCVARAEGQAELAFFVRDTGIGIDPTKQAVIFRAFEQEDASTTRRYGGTGLGLTIAARLVEVMGGKIEVESSPGDGSTFHFTTRFAVGEATLPVEARPRQSVRDLRVLVVDDNEVNRHILEQWLQSWEMRPTSVSGGFAALDALWHGASSGDPYSLVLLDARMPEIDGLALAQKIREREPLATTRIILLTSGDRPSDLDRLRDLRIEAHLLKPVPQDELLDAIYAVLEHPTRDAETSAPADDRRGVGRVLVAEDNEWNAKLVHALLVKQGHAVTLARDGREALALLTTEDFDFALVDLHMPELDGFGVVQALRAHEASATGAAGMKSHLPVIALTARARPEDRARCLAAGMDDFLVKPLRLDALSAVIARWGRSAAPAPAGPEPFLGELVDTEVLRAACGDDARILTELARGLALRLEDDVHALRALHTRGNFGQLREGAHTLCGMLAACSTALAEVASELEDLASREDAIPAGRLIAQLEAAAPRLARSLETITVADLRDDQANLATG